MVDVIPVGTAGIARIDHFEISPAESQWSAMRGGRDFVSPGRYAKLVVGGQLYMTDTRHEHNTNYEVLKQSRGDVLIAGLGLGMLLVPMMKRDGVRSVTVVEKYPDVIELVEAPLRAHLSRSGNAALSIMQGDIYEWRPAPKTKFDVIYFDIWADQSTDDLVSMTTLHKAFRKFRATGGWMESWNRDYLKARKRRGQ